ncbi:hypothetical protein COLO4_31926 [Corchorus olitorius]|uniref:Uncharacterized protein n=1 Tax=Corchorus olitorius TaxID=93759 RepID=A0A1R3H2V7_9ROSI|nr:hypothetical protein COLO4_31926 [Corchorus olitorius]
MGNCINLMLSPAEKAKVHIFNEEEEFRATNLVKEVKCQSLPRSTKPPPGEVGCGLPHDHSISLKIMKEESCQGRCIKIVVTRQQLEFLLRDAKKFQSMKRAVRSSGVLRRGNCKWKPSLSAIPEVPEPDHP